MKFQFNKKYTTITIYAGFLILFAVLCAYVFFSGNAGLSFVSKLEAIVLPMLIGMLVAYIVAPLYRLFDRKVFKFITKKKKTDRMRRFRKLVSLILAFIIFLSVIVFFFWIVVPQLVDSLTKLVRNLGSYMEPVREAILKMGKRNDLLGDIVRWAEGSFESMDSFLEKIGSRITSFVTNASSRIISFVQGAFNFVKYVLLGLFFAIYFLYYSDTLKKQANRFVDAFMTEKAGKGIRHVCYEIDLKFGRFLKGKTIDSLIIGFAAYVVLRLIGYQYSLLIALLVGVTNMIPVFGPFIGAIPSAFIVMITEEESFKMTLIFVIFIFILQQIDGNLLGPFILGDSIGLSPLWIMISITVMGGLFGVVGMFFGVPIFGVFYTLISEAVELRLEKKKRAQALTDAKLAELHEENEIKRMENDAPSDLTPVSDSDAAAHEEDTPIDAADH